MQRARAGTMTHDYKRHSTPTLFAAVNVLEGKVVPLSYFTMARPFSLMPTGSCFCLEKPPRCEVCSSCRPSLVIPI
jgi:hypothetical protein